MKKQSFLVFGAALLLACGSAFAGIATFSGATGDTTAQLPGVVYDPCSFTLPANASSDLIAVLSTADPLFVPPLFSDTPGVIEVNLVGNENPGGFLGIELSLYTSIALPDGTITAKLTSTELSLERTKSGVTQTLGNVAAVGGITRIQLELTDLNIVLRYDDGNSLVEVVSVNLGNVGTNNEVLTGDRIVALRLIASAGGPNWAFNRVVWTGTPVPDTNDPVGCDVVPVPDVVGLSLSDATTALTAAGFTPDVSYDGNINSPSPGDVVSQDPVAGTLQTGGTVSIVIGGIEVLDDSDGDGLSDAWEIQYFGDLTQNRWGDPDGDRSWNIREFVNGTDPTNPESAVPVADYRGLLALAVLLSVVGIFAALRMGRNAS